MTVLGLGLASALASCGDATNDRFCGPAGCNLTDWEWQQLRSLADLPMEPPGDSSNKYIKNAAAVSLGRKFFYDPRFSGASTQVDVLRRPVGYARAPKGQPSNLSCASCHDYRRAGTDTQSLPGNVSVGSAWSDTNSPPTTNAAYYEIVYWNGRADSLWAQAVASNEGTNMNGSRLETMWQISEHYRAEYAAVFPEWPLPALEPMDDVAARIESSGDLAGQCKRVSGACPTNLGCREVTVEGKASCWPRFPLEGKPGSKAGCQAGDPEEPARDAFDCMAKEDQDVTTRALVNWAKAIAAYEQKLVSRDAPFDRFVRDMVKVGSSTAISPAAQRGAKLFVGKAACIDCHSGPFLSDSKFHNIGVAQVGPGVPTESDCQDGNPVCDCVENPDGKDPMAGVRNCFPWGARDGIQRLQNNKFRRDSVWSDNPKDDSKMSFVKMSPASVPKGAWRTPTLRDVAITAPYMHNGSIATLEDVVWHYNQGGSAAAPGTRDARIKPLFLSSEEQADLVEFLRTLTGQGIPAEFNANVVLPP